MTTLCYRGVPVLGFAAYSGVGKTTVLKRLIPVLRDSGLRIGVVKHAHHEFDIDHPGKDSYELRHAGANQIIVGSQFRRAIIIEDDGGEEPRLPSFLAALETHALDLVLVEGFRHVRYPKIEIDRGTHDHLLSETDASIIAVITDRDTLTTTGLPLLKLHDTTGLSDFVQRYRERALHDLSGQQPT